MDESTFDQAAEIAKEDIRKRMEKDAEFMKAVLAVAVWWKSFYMTAGHKRLGRILVEIAKEFG
jgi:hypothetical protein